jgi:hypothetical protein
MPMVQDWFPTGWRHKRRPPPPADTTEAEIVPCRLRFAFCVTFAIIVAVGIGRDHKDSSKSGDAAVDESDELMERRLPEVTIEDCRAYDSREIEEDELNGNHNLPQYQSV